ncbi:hypothetical protein FRB94_000888, partial [Tulasnella sp. JGI-2019a]
PSIRSYLTLALPFPIASQWLEPLSVHIIQRLRRLDMAIQSHGPWGRIWDDGIGLPAGGLGDGADGEGDSGGEGEWDGDDPWLLFAS